MIECHCGKDGHALNSVNCPIHGSIWRPIESVPFDTRVLIWDGFDVCIAKTIRGEWISYGCDGPAVHLMDDFGTSYQEPGKPTHWLPVPNPPSEDYWDDNDSIRSAIGESSP